MLRVDLGLAGVWNANGVRAADSPNRRMAMVVLRYRCVIELTVDGADIPRHEAWHTDVYTNASGTRRCVWSQATGTMDLPLAAP